MNRHQPHPEAREGPANSRRPYRHELVEVLERLLGHSPTEQPHAEAMITALKLLELERAYTRERAIASVRRASNKQQRTLSEQEIAEAREKMALGLRPSEVAAAFGMSRTALYTALRDGSIWEVLDRDLKKRTHR